MRIEVNWGLCDGNGNCVIEAPEVFDIDERDELIVLQEEFDESLLPKVEAAVRACPKHALKISG